LLLSVDVGYGFTKAVTDSGHKISFPSVVAPAYADLLDGVFSNNIGHRVNVFTLDELQEKLVGNLALNSLAAQNIVARREKPAEIHDVLLMTAAYLCDAGTFSAVNQKGVALVVGLPLSFYRGQKSALQKRLSKLSAWVSVDGKERKHISFNKVMVFPQGAGALVSLGSLLPKEGLVGLIDIGTYTTDFMLFGVKNSMPVPLSDACGSIEAGIYLAQRAVANEFEKQAGSPLPQRMYQKAVEIAHNGNFISYDGRKIDLSPAWKQSQKEIAETISGHVLASWGDRTGFLDMTVFAGGGAIWFQNILEQLFPNSIYAQEGVFANAVGYLMMASGSQKP
jgi:plasmid segregation protein ParM